MNFIQQFDGVWFEIVVLCSILLVLTLAPKVSQLFKKFPSTNLHNNKYWQSNTSSECWISVARKAVLSGDPVELRRVIDKAGMPNTDFLEVVMKNLGAKNRHMEALQIYDEFFNLSHQWVECCTIAANYAIELHDDDKTHEYCSQVMALSGPSTLRSAMPLLKFFSQQGDVKKCVQLLELMQPRVTIDSVALNVVVNACVLHEEHEMARNLLSANRNLSDVVTYNTLLKSMPSYEEAKALLDEMEYPNVISFNTVLLSACREDCATVFRLLEEMQSRGAAPDKCTCSTLVKGLLRERSKAQSRCFQGWMRQLMDTVWGLGPLGNLGLKRSFASSILDLAVATENAVFASHVFDQMVVQYAAPRGELCDMMFQSYTQLEKPQLQNAEYYWQQMIFSEMEPSRRSYLRFCECFQHRHNLRDHLSPKQFEDALKAVVGQRNFHLAITMLDCRGSREWLVRSLKEKSVHDVIRSTKGWRKTHSD